MTENTLPMLVGDQPRSKNPEQARQPSAQSQEGSSGDPIEQLEPGSQRVVPFRRPLFRR